MSLRAKLLSIVSATGLAFLILIIASSLIERRIEHQLHEIQDRFLPRLELGPRLQHGFEDLTRSIQDATAAQDSDALLATRARKDALLATLDKSRGAFGTGDARELQQAFEDYYEAARGVAQQLIDDQTGEQLVEEMAGMQAKQVRASALLLKATALDQGQLGRAFAAATQAQATAMNVRLAITLSCMLLVLVLALALSRSVVRSVSEVELGLQRFGRGEFSEPIRVAARDELGALAQQANHMAASLKRLNEERDRSDWLRNGLADLSRELRGELEPDEVASRAARSIARALEAPLAAFYAVEKDGGLRLLGHHGASLEGEGSIAKRFEPGQGLVGQAAREQDVTVISSLPDSYVRVRSGLGDGRPRAIALAPLMHLNRAVGVLEIAVWKPWSDMHAELLRAVQETVAIALEVARARAALRDLLAETQRQAERLAAQEEELRANNDELQAQQEELQAQQEELRQTNDELTEQSKQLLAQQHALEQKNSELQDARLRIEQKADELATVSAYKSQFLANMSHELRTPLNSMLLLSNLLARNEAKNLSEKQVEHCKTIHGAGKDLLALINQVLDLAKIESGKQEAKLERVEIADLTGHCERIFAPLARDRGLDFQVEVARDVPAAIVSDRQRVEQILNNLVGNAIKFTERGSVSVRIHLPDTRDWQREDLAPDQTIAFSVIDTGIGIAPEQQERVFAPFEQVDARTDRRYGGTGLGLSIGKQLAAMLGGELQLYSERGKGSTFTCYLPLVAKPAAHTTAPHAPALRADASGDTENGSPHLPSREHVREIPDDRAMLAAGEGHVLVIEDDPVFAEVVGDVIHGQGFKCVIASSGQSGLALAKQRKPSGVILDVRLPDIDGFAVMEALRADASTAGVPVHFVSALEAGERGMALGAVGYLTKPASRRDIVRAVESIAPKTADRAYRVLIVEDDNTVANSLLERLGGDAMQARRVNSARDALELLRSERFGCMVLDLSLPDMDGLELLRTVRDELGDQAPPVVVYTGRPLNKAEAQRLEAYAEAVVLKEGTGVERLLDEVRLFARRLKAELPATRRASVHAQPIPLRLEGKRLLLVDDDMRTVYALSAVLRSKGADVLVADTGRAALDVLAKHPDVDLVLMDIMMPEMDGYEAIRRIRVDSRFRTLPIIALTAKAMKGDREKCIEVGATDYLPKPVDPDHLATMLQSQLAGAAHDA